MTSAREVSNAVDRFLRGRDSATSDEIARSVTGVGFSELRPLLQAVVIAALQSDGWRKEDGVYYRT